MTLHRCSSSDRMMPTTERRFASDGTMIVPARLARAGNIQLYRAGELGLDKKLNVGASQVLKFYRPPEEVFAADAVASANGRTLTNDHPDKKKFPQGVTADVWRKIACGDCQGVAQDGEFLAGTLHVRDGATIKAMESGKAEMSAGYDFDADMTTGTLANGDAYDGIMRNVRFNHFAVVDTARGGPGCRAADDQGEPVMKVIARDNLTVSLEDDGKAQIVEAILSVQDSKLKTAQEETKTVTTRAADAETKLSQAIKDLAARDTQIAELKGKIPTDAQIEAMAADRATLETDAKKLAPKVTCAGKGSLQIRREVVTSVLAGDKALAVVAEAVLTGAGVTAADAAEPTLKAAMSAVLPLSKAGDGGRPGPGVHRALAGANDTNAQDGVARDTKGRLVPTPEGALMRNMQRGFRAAEAETAAE